MYDLYGMESIVRSLIAGEADAPACCIAVLDTLEAIGGDAVLRQVRKQLVVRRK